MYTYYIVRLDLKDGDWGYVRSLGGGRFELTDDPNSARIFDTEREAQDFYYDVIGSRATVNGVGIAKVFITTITSQYPL